MKVISISQPFANLIVRGVKNIENFAYKTKYRGKVLIYANCKKLPKNSSGIINKYGPEFFQEFINQYYFCNLQDFDDFDYGAIVGYATLTDVKENIDSPWALQDCYNFVFEDAYFFEKPIKMKINSGFTQIDFDENLLLEAKKFDYFLPKIIDNCLNIRLNKNIFEFNLKKKLLVINNSFGVCNLLDSNNLPIQFEQAFVKVDNSVYSFRVNYVAFRESFDFFGQEFLEICAKID